VPFGFFWFLIVSYVFFLFQLFHFIETERGSGTAENHSMPHLSRICTLEDDMQPAIYSFENRAHLTDALDAVSSSFPSSSSSDDCSKIECMLELVAHLT
jgi:hypothetical protein